MDLGEVEAGALRAWESAEKLFAARNFKGAKDAYDAFVQAHGQTKTAAAKAEALKERFAVIDKVLGPASTIAVGLAPGVKMEFVMVNAGEFEMGSNDGAAEKKPVHRVTISKPYYISVVLPFAVCSRLACGHLTFDLRERVLTRLGATESL